MITQLRASQNTREQSQKKFQQMLERQMAQANEFARMVYEKQTSKPIAYKAIYRPQSGLPRIDLDEL